MITELILDLVLFVPLSLLSLLSDFGFELPNIPEDWNTVFTTLLVGVAYVLPVSYLLPIFLSRIAIYIFKIVVAFVCRIKSFIPTMGA